MANQQSFYFYPPTWDIPPDRTIKLGNVLTNVSKPHRPLHCSPPTANSQFEVEETSVQHTKEKLRSGHFSILTRFLSILGLGVDVGAEASKTDEEVFIFDTLNTAQFIPDPTYLQSCIDNALVRNYLFLSNYRKPLYIITGVKTVTGIKANTSKIRTLAGFLEAEIDGTILTGGMAPVATGPRTEARQHTGSSSRWESRDSRVFAFRVSKIMVSERSGQVSTEEEYTRGAVFEKKSAEDRRSQSNALEVRVVDMTYEGFVTEELTDGGDSVTFAVQPQL